MTKYTTYAYYNHKGNRLAIFGVEHIKGTIHIYVFECSRKDQFSKRVANEAFEHLMFNPHCGKPVSSTGRMGKHQVGNSLYLIEEMNLHTPQVYEMYVKDGKPKKTFIDFCRNSYKKPHYRKVVTIEKVLTVGSKQIILNSRKVEKLDAR